MDSPSLGKEKVAWDQPQDFHYIMGRNIFRWFAKSYIHAYTYIDNYSHINTHVFVFAHPYKHIKVTN